MYTIPKVSLQRRTNVNVAWVSRYKEDLTILIVA